MRRSHFSSHRSSLFLALSLPLVLTAGTGCSSLWKTPGTESTKTASKTSIGEGAAVGAFSGAALGGGVGAIIGSTSGHAGEGLAVGALAGGVAGAGVGAAVTDYRNKQASRRDSKIDEENVIRDQRRELNSVKDSLGDDVATRSKGHAFVSGSTGSGSTGSGSFADSGRGGSRSGYGIMENYRGNPQAKPFRGASGSGSIPASIRTSSATQSGHPTRIAWNDRTAKGRGQLGDSFERSSPKMTGYSSGIKNTALKTPSHNSTATTAKTAALKSQVADSQELGAGAIDEPPVRTVGGKTVMKEDLSLSNFADGGTSNELPPAAKAVTTGKAAVAKSMNDADAEVSKADAVVAKQLGKLPADGNTACIQAEKEAARATNATSDADRLFYLGRASRLCPGSDTYQVELGKVFAKIGKNSEAKTAFKKAAELNPQNDVAHDELSILENTTR